MFSLFGSWYDDKSNTEIVKEVLVAFINSAKFEWSTATGKDISQYPNTVDTLLSYYATQRGGQINQLAEGIKMADIGSGTMIDGVGWLAKKGRGKPPQHISGFINAIQGKAVDTPFLDAMVEIQAPVRQTLNIGKELIVENVKLQVAGAKFIRQYLPIIGIGIAVVAAGYFLAQARSFKGEK